MKIIYKYLPDDFPLEKHLNSPELKLSLVNTLNDPYEGQMTKHAIDKFSDSLLKHSDVFTDFIKDKGYDLAKKIAISTIKQVLNNTCITSFSETQRNLLMWAHYSAQHKGICIGYDVDVLLHENSDATLRKVNYDSVLYDQDHLDELDHMSDFESDETDSFCYRLFTTKSNDWIYEKEHRFISSCETASRIFVDCPYEKISPEVIDAINAAKLNKTHKIIKNKNSIDIYNIRNKDAQLLANEKGTELEAVIAEKHKALLFKEISESKIKSIYLGVFFDKGREKKLINLIKKNNKLKHINIYRYEMSQERYELTPCKLYPIPATD
ncbi:DUF2971 domain-containing protein [Aeromonas media]|uniref:DUF2971 domain-containing protein n=1 Tax=Aeromonas media TaxID=651 RepID=UPI0029DD89F3|nr:DUF2971 domain-containing protein [Aeromonas media]MDX7900057.1 DUF2971 domain-containing protein [Aeromonas media]